MISIVYNPVSGKRNMAERISAETEAYLKSKGHAVTRTASQKAGHITELAKQAAMNGDSAFIVVGGDGSCSEAAAGLALSRCALGIVPCGTGNDFCKTAGIPRDPRKAMELIASSQPVETDVGIINGERIFLNEAGAGFDVDVLRRAAKYKKRFHGMLPYLIGVLSAACHYRTMTLSYEIGGEKHVNEQMTVCSIANGQFIGGGIQIAPLAVLDDGLFDIELLRPISAKHLAQRVVTLLKKKILSMPEMTRCTSDCFAIESKGMYVNIDGEVLPMDRAEFRLLKHALLVYRTKGGAE